MATDKGMQLSDLEWATLNSLGEDQARNSGDRRRGTSKTFLDKALRDAYSKNSLKGTTYFYGIVVTARSTTYPVHAKKDTLLQDVNAVDTNAASLYYVYKVYIPEIECRPAPRAPDDPILYTYPDVVPAKGVDTELIPVGTVVKIQYANLETLKDPIIVSIEGDQFFTFEGVDLKNLKSLWTSQPKNLLERMGTKEVWGSTESQREMMASAKRLKEIRREIFEDQGLKLKSGKNWDDNAILSLDDQKRLLKENEDKIKTVEDTLKMPRGVLQKIFKKESGTFDPYAINHNTSATGLIQFMPEFSSAGTAGELGTTVEALLRMGPAKQLDYVQQYFQKNMRADMPEEVDWYFVVFYPAAIGKTDDYVIGANPATTAEVNPGYADPKHEKKYITRRSVKEKWAS